MGKSHYRSKNTVRIIQNRMPIYDSAEDALLESENYENYMERCCHKLRYSDEAGNQIYTFKYYINFNWNFISMWPKNIQMPKNGFLCSFLVPEWEKVWTSNTILQASHEACLSLALETGRYTIGVQQISTR